jgi:CheY-like chemotaxis protein
LEGSDVKVRFRLQNDLPKIIADRLQLSQALMNFIADARAAIIPGGSLLIETSTDQGDQSAGSSRMHGRSGHYVRLSVSGAGVGIARGLDERSPVSSGTTANVPKPGLTLSMVWCLVKRSGGFISLHSDPGHSDIFNIFIPAVERQEENLIASETAHDFRDRSGRPTVLIVEDQTDLLQLAGSALETSGFHVLKAASAADAISIAQNCLTGIDLMIAEVAMPDLSGRKLAEFLQKSRPGLRILYVSGGAGESASLETEADCMNFISRPFSSDQLVTKARQALA